MYSALILIIYISLHFMFSPSYVYKVFIFLD